MGAPLAAQVGGGENETLAEITLPHAVDHRPRRGGRSPIDQPFGQRQPRWIGAGVELMQVSNAAGLNDFGRLEEIAPVEAV